MEGFALVIVFFMIVIIVVSVIVGRGYESVLAGFIAAVLVTLALGWSAGSMALTSFAEDRVVTCTVTDKDRGGGKDGSYRVYTSDCGVLANGDNPFHGKFNSADVWQQIPDEGPVTVHIVGVRNGLFSWFPNIIEVKQLE